MVVGMKKSKTESERDLLAKNHKRLNKAIDDLLNENREIRKRLVDSERQVLELLDKMDRMKQEEYMELLNTATHSLAGKMDLTSQQVAERAHSVAIQVQLNMPSNDNAR